MRLYLTQQSFSTFGQTEAGAHSAWSDETVVTSCEAGPAPWGGDREVAINWEKEQIALLNLANPVLQTRGQGIHSGKVYLPRTPDVVGLIALIMQHRGPNDPYVTPAHGHHRFVLFNPEDLKLDKAGQQLNSANLAWQKELLR